MWLHRTKSRPAPTRLGDGERIYAIGDVHGCAAHLAYLHRQIAADLTVSPVLRATVVHLGDYIDRGVDSAGVLEQLLSPPAALARCEMVNLRGNHEAMLLAAFDGDDLAEAIWLANGGHAALQSWGADSTNWRSAIPRRHVELLRGTRHLHEQGGYLFVHAGINPDLPLEDQSKDELLWIREPFLSFDGQLSHVVVHGHTPTETPTVRAHRIGIDTGAVFGGQLTCLVLQRQQLRFWAVGTDDVRCSA